MKMLNNRNLTNIHPRQVLPNCSKENSNNEVEPYIFLSSYKIIKSIKNNSSAITKALLNQYVHLSYQYQMTKKQTVALESVFSE